MASAITKDQPGEGLEHTLKCDLCIIADYYVDEKIVKKFTA